MLPENIVCAFKNKASFIKLEIKSECFFYLEARNINGDFISNFITWNLSNKPTLVHIKSLLNPKLKTNIFPGH